MKEIWSKIGRLIFLSFVVVMIENWVQLLWFKVWINRLENIKKINKFVININEIWKNKTKWQNGMAGVIGFNIVKISKIIFRKKWNAIKY